jgi:dihydrofolate reductase
LYREILAFNRLSWTRASSTRRWLKLFLDELSNSRPAVRLYGKGNVTGPTKARGGAKVATDDAPEGKRMATWNLEWRRDMRKIRIFEHISLDGVISPHKRNEGDDDFANGGWTAPYRSPAGAEALAEAQGKGFDLLLGRRTYDLWASYWPKVTSGPFAAGLNAATKYVATHRPESLGWGPIGDLGADILAAVRRVKSQDGPDLIMWGSSTLTSVLLEQALVDEVVLIVYPVLLGRGIRFFSETADPRELALVSTKATSTGVSINTYRHIGSLQKRVNPPM